MQANSSDFREWRLSIGRRFFGFNGSEKYLTKKDFFLLLRPKKGFTSFIKSIQYEVLPLAIISFFILLHYHSHKDAPLMKLIQQNLPSSLFLNTIGMLGFFLGLITLILNDPLLNVSPIKIFSEKSRFYAQKSLSACSKLGLTGCAIFTGLEFSDVVFKHGILDILLIPIFLYLLFILFLMCAFIWWLSESFLSKDNQPILLEKFYRMPIRGRVLFYGIFLLDLTLVMYF